MAGRVLGGGTKQLPELQRACMSPKPDPCYFFSKTQTGREVTLKRKLLSTADLPLLSSEGSLWSPPLDWTWPEEARIEEAHAAPSLSAL